MGVSVAGEGHPEPNPTATFQLNGGEHFTVDQIMPAGTINFKGEGGFKDLRRRKRSWVALLKTAMQVRYLSDCLVMRIIFKYDVVPSNHLTHGLDWCHLLLPAQCRCPI